MIRANFFWKLYYYCCSFPSTIFISKCPQYFFSCSKWLTIFSRFCYSYIFFFFSSRRRHTRYWRDWSSDVCSSDLPDAEKLLREILDGMERENAAISIETLQAKIAASTACHAAIKVNTPLEQSKMEWLLDALAKTDCPMSCPHGRPVVLRYSIKEIEKAFHRI